MIESIVIIVVLILEGFFSGTETALVSCNKMRIRYKMEKGSPTAKVIWSLLKNPHKVLATTLVGTNLCVVTGSIFATHLFMRLFADNGPIIATCFMTPLILIFGEMLPKSICRVHGNALLFFTAPILAFFQKLLFPIIKIVEFLTALILKGFGLKYTKKDPFLTKEDIELLVRQITKEGVLERSEQSAIHQIFDFRYTRVGNIMIRLRDIISIDYNDDRKTIIEKAKKSRLTRYPVLENRQIKGLLNIFDIFYNEPRPDARLDESGRGERDWHKFIRPIRQVYANQRINRVLYQMQRNKELISAVVRKGKFIGIISLEDIIKEIELV